MIGKNINGEVDTYNEIINEMYNEGAISTKFAIILDMQRDAFFVKDNYRKRCFSLSQTGIDQFSQQYASILKDLQMYGGFDLVEHLRELIA